MEALATREDITRVFLAKEMLVVQRPVYGRCCG